MIEIRVLHCVVCLGRGGTETLLMNVYRNIDRTKVQFDFLTSIEGEYEAEVKALGGRVYRTPFISTVGPFAYAKKLRTFFAAHPEYKIVHSHMDKFSGMVVREAKNAGVPVRIAHCHSIGNAGNLEYRAVKNYYGTKVLANATQLFACSKSAAQWMFGKMAGQAIIIKNGVDLESFCFCPIAHSIPTIVHVGSFTALKNHAFLLEVFNEVLKASPHAQLMLVGDGSLKLKMQQKAQKLGISPNVCFLGSCANVADVLNSADVFCLPSLFEGLGMVLIEAQACGLPCLASTGVPQEANAAGKVTYLSLRESKIVWAQALLSLAQQSKKENIAQLRSAGYDIKETALQLQNFYIVHSN